MSRAYDAIVVGAGHNGLTTAALLAKAGRKVLVLERREHPGGLAASEEFHPGYRSAGLLGDTGLVRPSVIAALDLPRHGLRLHEAPPTVLALGDGSHEPIAIHGRLERAAEAIARISPRDGQQYRELAALMQRLAPAVRELLGRHPLDLVDLESERVWDLGKRALRLRRLGRDDLRELLRLPPMSVAEVLGERFETERLRAALCLPALLGTFGGPEQPGNMLELMRLWCLRGPGVLGGGPMLVAALRAAAQAAGVELRTGAAVAGLRVGTEGIDGVRLEDGGTIDARLVAASCSPRLTLEELLPAGLLPQRLEHRIHCYRSRGRVAVVHLALRRPPRFAGEPAEFARTGEHVTAIERAFDATKYDELPAEPALELHLATEGDPGRAPEGHAVLSATVYFVPTRPRDGWTDGLRERLGDAVVRLLARHDAGLPEAVVAREVLTPADLESRYGIPGGHLFHGEHGLDQLMFRPTPECIHYATPLPGLWLCGSGSHPGGGLSCAPGELAAQAILASS